MVAKMAMQQPPLTATLGLWHAMVVSFWPQAGNSGLLFAAITIVDLYLVVLGVVAVLKQPWQTWFLPLMLMERDGLIEKHAKAAGLCDVHFPEPTTFSPRERYAPNELKKASITGPLTSTSESTSNSLIFTLRRGTQANPDTAWKSTAAPAIRSIPSSPASGGFRWNPPPGSSGIARAISR